ncbi:MAG: putative transporter substrate-binding protein [Modestobacter sp.]|jgi:simple sugar transport system substrate-binding protein|nr:putative transporter substrate-binding protein [Modestobacter sp.]MCW2507625.1 putative transporter substrate-binding protein [Modestobacter sp.]MCW2577923.1 putative transporter substrate-binding protein [Modestobacter sp.]MCW2619063.1 putative transporter substrate-binding protein [Modestobacter sp.]
MRNTRRPLQALVAVTVATMALAACSSSGGAKNAGGGNAGGQDFTIAMITHESPGDTFWDKIRAGADQAAKDHGMTLNYSSDPDAGKEATLVQNAVDSKVDGIAVTLAFPDAVGPAAKSAIAGGVPVVAFNSGIGNYQDFGVPMYFGSNEDLAGQTVGRRIAQDGGGKALCVIQEQGQVALETRCAGVAKAFPNTENLNVNGADLPSVQQTIGAKLQQDPSITDVVTLGAPIALGAMQAKADSGSQAKVITFDLNADVAQAIQNGTIAFSVDQQPYVQGYMAVTALWLNLTNGNDIGGGQPVLTGPSIVDAKNIGPIVQYAKNNTR